MVQKSGKVTKSILTNLRVEPIKSTPKRVQGEKIPSQRSLTPNRRATGRIEPGIKKLNVHCFLNNVPFGLICTFAVLPFMPPITTVLRGNSPVSVGRTNPTHSGPSNF